MGETLLVPSAPETIESKDINRVKYKKSRPHPGISDEIEDEPKPGVAETAAIS